MQAGPNQTADSGAAGTAATGVTSLPYADARGVPMPADPAAPASRYDVAVVALRLLGIYILLQGMVALTWAAEVVRTLISGGGFTDLLYATAGLIPLTVCVVVGVFFLKAAPRLATRMLPDSNVYGGAPDSPAGTLSLQAIAFSVAGAVIATLAIPRFCYTLALTLREVRDVYAVTDHGGTFLRALLEPGVQLALGVWLFLGSKRLAGYWHRIRRPELAAEQEAR